MMARTFTIFSFLMAATLCQIVHAKEPVTTAEQPLADSTQPSNGKLTVEEVRALLGSIDPYLPEAEVATEIDIFGSTSMDALAHGWLEGFKKFHPKAKIVISAEGSETVFDRMLNNPNSVGMLSRPVSTEDLKRLKAEGLENPVAIQVARDAMAVVVHESNPLKEITYPQLVRLFCTENPAAKITWGELGIEGDLASKNVQLVGRNKGSGTRTFTEKYLFHAQKMRADEKYCSSNAEVLQAIADNPQAIGIADLKLSAGSVRRLNLRHNTTVFDGDEHDVLIGKYPIIRSFALVFDLGDHSETSIANRELARYALSQAGQLNAILAGFFPCDPPTLRGEMSKLDIERNQRMANASADKEAAK